MSRLRAAMLCLVTSLVLVAMAVPFIRTGGVAGGTAASGLAYERQSLPEPLGSATLDADRDGMPDMAPAIAPELLILIALACFLGLPRDGRRLYGCHVTPSRLPPR